MDASTARGLAAALLLTTLGWGSGLPEAGASAPEPEVRQSRVNLAALAREVASRPTEPPRIRRVPQPGAPRRARRPAKPDPIEAAPRATLAPGESSWPVVTFEALPDDGTSIPPDTAGAVGPDHVVTALNTQIRVQTRTGTTLATLDPRDFWASVGGDPFDPKVLYDASANRWMFTEVADGFEPTSSILLGVSATSDPTGDWHLHRIDADPQNRVWADYPGFGFNKNWISVTLNMFGIREPRFERADVYVFDKAQLYAGGAASFRRFSKDDAFTLAPAVTHDPALEALFFVEDTFNGFLRISRVSGAVGAEVMKFGFAFADGPRGWESFVDGDILPQLGTRVPINGGDSRMQSCVFRNGTLWATHSVALPPGNPDRMAVQWWQMETDGTVLQFARIDDPSDGASFAFPSIAVNRNDDVLIGYSRFSPEQFASANLAYRQGSDPPGTLRPERVFKAGEAPYVKTFGGSRNRWGDYSATVVDPTNDIDMWTVQEFAAEPDGRTDHWGTQWAMIGGDGGAGEGQPPALGLPDTMQAVVRQEFLQEIEATGTPPFTFAMIPPDAVPGLSLAGTRIAGVPSTVGVFAFEVTATTPFGTDRRSVSMTVLADSDGDGAADSGDPDDDDDGFGDAVEQAFGTDPLDASSTPCGGAPLAGNRGIRPRLRKAEAKLNFAAPSADSIRIEGVLPVEAGFSPAGAKFAVEFGGVLRVFTLDAAARGRIGASDTCSLKLRKVRGAVVQQNAPFRVALVKGEFRDDLADDGLRSETVAAEKVDIRVVVFLDRTCSNFEETREFVYTAREGRSGKATLLRSAIQSLIQEE